MTSTTRAFFGAEMKLFYSIPGIGDGADWKELTRIREAAVNPEMATVDATTRAAGGFRQRLVTLQDAPITFKIPYDPTNDQYQALADAFFGRELIGISAGGDPAVEADECIVFDAHVTRFHRAEGLEDFVLIDVELQPAYSENQPYVKRAGET